MFTGMKKVAANLQGSSSGHSELSMAIYQEKCVQESIRKMIVTRKEASAAWLRYANNEQSEAVKELFLKMHTIDSYWLKSYEQYYEKYECYRGYFQEILKGERTVDEFRKSVEEFNPKIAKIQKQIDSLGAKGKDKKYDALSIEKGKYLSMQQKAKVQLEQRQENHSLFKYRNIKDAVKLVTDSQIELHEKCFEIFQTQRLLLDYFTATTYTSITQGVIKQANSSGKCLLNDLEKKLGFQTEQASDGFPMAEPSRQILDELEDIFGTPASVQNAINREDEATYNPIPEAAPDLMLSPHDREQEKRSSRPLPELPPTAPEESEEEDYVYSDPCTTQPIIPDTSELYQNQEFPPPIPPRKDIKSITSQDSSTGSSRANSRKSTKSDAGSDKTYLKMDKSIELRPNSVYEGGDNVQRNSYLVLADAYSGSRGSSIKSTGSASSKGDSGLDSRGSLRSNTSNDQPDQDEEIYEILDGRAAVQKPFSEIKDDVYEL